MENEMNDEAEVMEPEVEVNPMQTFVDDILQKNFAGAQSAFNDLLGDKLNDALDAEKVALAQQVYNGEEPPEDDQFVFVRSCRGDPSKRQEGDVIGNVEASPQGR